MSDNDTREPKAPDATRPAGCPAWCISDHKVSSTFHHGPDVQLDLPAGPYTPDGPLLMAAIMQLIESEEEGRGEPIVSIQGATERDLDLPGLDQLIERLDDYMGRLHRLRQDYVQAIGVGRVSRA
ncbi:hypothetical protein GCM10020229_84390 [Kitasatospora albolonga]|uniref:DUF6907 domain-containing protein n=1 Tax=Kitasatospora albolonga TaxID=68173 RepID=UPI0031EF6437